VADRLYEAIGQVSGLALIIYATLAVVETALAVLANWRSGCEAEVHIRLIGLKFRLSGHSRRNGDENAGAKEPSGVPGSASSEITTEKPRRVLKRIPARRTKGS
jgi:hypothetical protein